MMNEMTRRIALISLIMLALGGMAGVTVSADPRAAPVAATAGRCAAYDQPEAELTLNDARRFRRFDLFYAGSRVLGLPLTAVLCSMQPTVDQPVITKPPSAYGLMPRWTFIYGTCKASSEEGCRPPVEIMNDGSCWNNLRYYSKRDRTRLGRLRGVPASLSSSFDGGEVLLYTRRTTVTIDAPNLSQARRIALALYSASGRYGTRRLPSPSSRTLEGKTTCRSR